MDGKLTFYVKNEFQIENVKFPKKRKILRIFSIFCEFSNYAKPAGAGKVRFLRFHQKSENFTKMTKILEIS